MLAYDESEKQRRIAKADEDDFARLPPPPAQGSITVVGITVNGTPNDIQRVVLGRPPTGGTFTLAGRVLAYNASAATVQAALVLTYGSGNVNVTGGPLSSGFPFVVTFVGALAGTLVAPMTLNLAALTPSPATGGVIHVARGEPTYPVSAGVFYRIQKAHAVGYETVGGLGGTSPTESYIYAYNLGQDIPPLNTVVKCTRVSRIWVFRW